MVQQGGDRHGGLARAWVRDRTEGRAPAGRPADAVVAAEAQRRVFPPVYRSAKARGSVSTPPQYDLYSPPGAATCHGPE